jgi:CTP:molybdopterin cytidylyltransferase MocA
MLESAVQSLEGAGIEEIHVILGYRAQEIIKNIRCSSRVKISINPDYDQGMLTSVRVGVRAMRERGEAFLLLPVDCPSVAPQTVQKILQAYKQTGNRIISPIYDGKAGHPCLISLDFSEEILESCLPRGLRSLMQSHADEILRLQVDDPGVRIDLDTPERYRQVAGERKDEQAITKKEIR